MPASKPVFVGGTNPTAEIPVSGGTLLGKINNMPMEMMQSGGNMFSGKGPAGSPPGATQGGAPVNFPGGGQAGAGGGMAPGGGQAQSIFGGGQQFGNPTQVQTGQPPNLYAMISQMLYGQGGA